MPELILVITEFYTLNTGDTDFFAYHVLWFRPMTILRILLYLALTLKMPEGDLCQKEKPNPFYSSTIPMEMP